MVAQTVVDMSGIVGVAMFDGTPLDRSVVQPMAAAASHRSRDGMEAWAAEGAAFAYQRLRLLNGTDEKGLAETDGLVCVADARLDNRRELLAGLDLSENLEAPLSESDLILHCYRKWGKAALARMVGDFAFVIWDTKSRKLSAARDPMAMRSLAYYFRPRKMVAVATEVKQLLVLHDVPVRVNEVAVLADLLADFGKPAWSFYDGISNVPPGHLLEVDEHGARTTPFWAPEPAYRLWLDSEQEYADHLRDRLTDAVAARLRTSRPAGVLLSGGVDSGSVAGTAGWLLENQAIDAPAVHAFSWAFDELRECDEREVSRLIVDRYRFLQTDIAADHLGPLAGYPDHPPDRDDPMLGAFQPLIEKSLEAAAAAGVGVLLGGDRGDLVIGTTGWSYLRLLEARQWAEFRGALREHRRATADSWALIARRHLLEAVVGRLRGRSLKGWLTRPFARVGAGGEPSTPPWLLPSAALSEAVASREDATGTGFDLPRASRRDLIFTQLHIRGMAWSERTYAKYGLGFADPFSDRRLVEFAIAAPQVVLGRPGDVSKPLMRAAMVGRLPEEARRRASKVLPTPLYETSLRHGAAATVRALMTRPRVAEHGWVDPGHWQAHYEAWRAGRSALRAEWWWTLAVEIWLRRYW